MLIWKFDSKAQFALSINAADKNFKKIEIWAHNFNEEYPILPQFPIVGIVRGLIQILRGLEDG